MHRSLARTLAAATAVAVVGGVAATSMSSPAAAVSYVANPSFVESSTGWKASTHAKKSRVRTTLADKTVYAGRATAKQSRGKKDIKLTSTLSPTRVTQAKSLVRSTARIKASTTRKRLDFRLEEVYGGKVIAAKNMRVTSRGGWQSVKADLRSTKAGSRVRVYVRADSMSRRHYVQIAAVKISVAPATAATKPAATTVAACEAINYKDPAQGSLTYADEFNGTKLDPTKWRVRDNTFLNQDGAFISKDNVSVHDGYLDIMGKREPESKWRSNAQSLYGEENRVRKYSTGYVDSIKNKTYESPDAASKDRFSQRYGYFEARMWVPSSDKMSQGIWPAFWLRADTNLGEIDVMESYGSPTIRKNFDPSRSYEWNSWHDTSQKSTYAHFLGRPEVDEPIHRTWHTYGINWSPTCLRYTFDGKTVGIARPIAGEVPYLNGGTFNSPFHIRFNMQVGSKYWGWSDPEVTRDQFNFKIDYVRVYQGKVHAK